MKERTGRGEKAFVEHALGQRVGVHAGIDPAEPAGRFGWVDTGVDTDALAQRMLDEGFLTAPGSLFHATRTAGTLMRINFATTQDAAFWRVFSRLRRELG